MYAILNIGSLLLGMLAWILPVIAIVRRKYGILLSSVSFSLCSISLMLQLLYTQYLVSIRDWSAIEDTHYAVVRAGAILLIVAGALNAAAILAERNHK